MIFYYYFNAFYKCELIHIFQEYSTALQFIKAFLHMQPGNMQAQNLLVTIQKKMESGMF